VSRLATVALALGVSLLPGLALACPACANRGDGSTLSTVYFLGAMMVFPFGVAAAVVKVIQGVSRSEDAVETVSTENK